MAALLNGMSRPAVARVAKDSLMCLIGVSWLIKNKCVEEARIGVGCRSLKRLANCSNHHSPGASLSKQ